MTATLLWQDDFPLLRLEGPGARDFLQGQTSADLKEIPNGVLVQSCWLSATGRLRGLLEIRMDPTGADVLVLAGEADAITNGFDQVIFPADRVRVSAGRRQQRLQTLPDADTVAWLLPGQGLPKDCSDLPLADADALEQWRLLQGWPSSQELTGDTNPFELGLARRISLSKGCYLGQETMAKLASSGGVKQQLRCWSSTAAISSEAKLECNGDRAGVVTSSLEVTPGQRWIGLALVRRQWLQEGELEGPEGQCLILQRPGGFQDPPVSAGSS